MRNAAESRIPLASENLATTRRCTRDEPSWAPAELRWPLRVGVLIDLEWSPRAGGHVKSWERLAEAATRLPDLVDLTIHLQGRAGRVCIFANNVRFATHRPVFSTAMLLARSSVPDHTDLAPLHPGLLNRLWRYDVIHTTDAHFAYARTARLAARLWNTALVHSVHTETSGYTRLYSEMLLQRLPAVLGRPLIDKLHLPDRLANRMTRRLQHHLAACDKVLLSARGDPARLGLPAAGPRIGLLRRGIDKDAFNPKHRDRTRLEATYGVPPERAVLMFAGRIEHGKSVMTLAAAARRLLDRGLNLAVVMAGDGSERDSVLKLLGDRAVLPGTVDPKTLAWLYASSDLFVFPSRIEESPNVVLEAKACGVPVLVAPGGGDVFVAKTGADGIIVADPSPESWATAIGELLGSPARRAALAEAARADVVNNRPSWDDVLAEDLIPVWQAAVAAHARRPRPANPDLARTQRAR
ncbi:MAG: glycosyltransferase [Rhodospirillaceae bacterium]|nr:glycosyltransferase [Rhodospirillaceae bacterium]